MDNRTDAAIFGTTLNNELNGGKIGSTDKVSPEAFPNFTNVMPSKAALVLEAYNNTLAAAESGEPIISEQSGTWSGKTVDLQQIAADDVSNETRDAFKIAMEKIEALNKQAIISNVQATALNKAYKKVTNPNHYGSGKKRPQKLSKPAKFFGNSKDIIYVQDKGVTKPMSLKTASKKGFI